MTYRQGRFWQPDVTVATVVIDQGRLLCVEEHAGGALVLNQPAGHLEPDESLLDAAVRETLEETGWTVELEAFVGAYQWTSPALADGSGGRSYLRFAFAARPIAHDPARRLDEGIERAQQEVARRSGFTVRGHSLILYGDCERSDCPHRPLRPGKTPPR